jgi:hypothetical protein
MRGLDECFVARRSVIFRAEKSQNGRPAQDSAVLNGFQSGTNEKARTRRAFEFGRELLRGPRYGKYSIAEVACCFSRRSNFDAPV